MPRNKKHFYSKIIFGEIVFWNSCDVDLCLILGNRVYFYALLQIICNCNNLRMITFYVHLLNFTLTECSHVFSEEILEQDSILFKMGCSEEPSIHYDILGLLMVAEHREQVVLYKD